MARILIAEDEEGLREFLADALEATGHEITTAADGHEAARLLAARDFDVLLTDLRMPGLDGIGLLRLVRSTKPQVQVVLLTAYGTVETAVEAMKLGAFDYLQKPLRDPTELRQLVHRAAERHELLAVQDRLETPEDGSFRLTWSAPSMKPVVEALRKVAQAPTTVLLLGETGTGKEVAALAVHAWSPRRQKPFIAVHCASLSEHLVESELFGHERGAFTGATELRRGRIEMAEGGTLFLDEIGELKPDLQIKLLRVLETRRFERVGGSRTIEADVRWMAATNRDLPRMIAEGRFREDLYHRLAVFPVRLPPLRERREDILPLADTLLLRIQQELGHPRLELSPQARSALVRMDWSGNVRQLRNALERSAILAEPGPIDVQHLQPGLLETAPTTSSASTLDDIERNAILQALEQAGGNRKQAAERLGIGLRTLYDKLKRFGIT